MDKIAALASTIKSVTRAMLEMERAVPDLELYRKDLLLRVERGQKEDINELQQHILGREQLREALDAMILAVNNSSATLEKFERKAAKDRLTLNEAKKKKGPASLGDNDPVLIAQRKALARAMQSLEAFVAELRKLQAALDQKYSARSLPELGNLRKALEADGSRFDDYSVVNNLLKSLQVSLGTHHFTS